MLDPPPTATKASHGPSARAASTAYRSDTSVGSTCTPVKRCASMRYPWMVCTTCCGPPAAATPGSVMTRTRRAPNRLMSNPTSSAAPGPNLRLGAPKVNTVSAGTGGSFPQRFQHRADPVGDGDRAARNGVDVHVYEPAHRGRFLGARGEQREAVHHAGVAEPFQPDAGGDDVREPQRREVPAGGLHHHADRGQRADVHAGRLDEPAVDRGVEHQVVHDVVHMAVDVLVRPPGRQLAVYRKVLAPQPARIVGSHRTVRPVPPKGAVGSRPQLRIRRGWMRISSRLYPGPGGS